jgi:hypothetical protein
MQKLNHFYNEGFGWICRNCELDLEKPTGAQGTLSRLFTEGEAESKQPLMSNNALAKWADAEHRILNCPRCGITELVGKS